jgi:pimeloyl-ACP methyl ester carboxylesterase
MSETVTQSRPSGRRVHELARSHFIDSSDEAGLRLHLRARADDPDRAPVLFVHGATYASRLYDIPHRRANWLEATAQAGFAAYALDIRGFGRSYPANAPAPDRPYARAEQAVCDIGDAVAWLRERHGAERIRLVGGSWGSITSATYASTAGRAHVERLVLYAPIFAERNQGWLSFLADPQEPACFDPAFGAYRLIDEEQTRLRWDEECPTGQQWREGAVLAMLFETSADDDPQSVNHKPRAFRAPNGALADLWAVFNERPLYDPAAISCPALLVRGSADATSTRSDALALLDHLGSTEKRYVEIANGGHFLSAERRAPQVFATVNAFLAETIR